MRITQTMLQNNMLNNLFKSQAQMDKYLTQINTGKKIRRPSEDPVVAMKGMGHRTELAEVEQYRRNASEVWSWMDNSDDALDKATKAMQRMEELSIQAANGTYDKDERIAIAKEVEQLKEHLEGIANTNVNGKYIFNGTDIEEKPVIDGVVTDSGDSAGRNNMVKIEVSNGIMLEVNVKPDEIFNQDLFDNIDTFINTLNGKQVELEEIENEDGEIELVPVLEDGKPKLIDIDDAELQSLLNDSIGKLNKGTTGIVNGRAELGARMNRLELIEDRLSQQEIIATDTMMKNEGVDFEEAVTNLLTQEVIHRAALAAGAKIIQPSLVDFLR